MERSENAFDDAYLLVDYDGRRKVLRLTRRGETMETGWSRRQILKTSAGAATAVALRHYDFDTVLMALQCGAIGKLRSLCARWS